MPRNLYNCLGEEAKTLLIVMARRTPHQRLKTISNPTDRRSEYAKTAGRSKADGSCRACIISGAKKGQMLNPMRNTACLNVRNT